jgi:lambda family phage tail tape measure protein
MTTETIKLQVDNAQALRGLNQVSQASDRLNAALGTLRNVLGGLALGNIVRQTLAFADSIQDVSDVTGIATTTILAFNNAVSANGGSAQGAQNAINKLVLTIGEAAEGGKAAQVAFNEIGISLTDLQYLSEQEIFQRTIDGLAKIEDNSKRARLQNELLGKGLRGVNLAAVSGALPTGATGASASSIKAAADAQDKLVKITQDLQVAFINLLTPVSKFATGINTSVAAIEKFLRIVASIAAAILSFTVFGRVIGVIVRVVAGLASKAEALQAVLLNISIRLGNMGKVGAWLSDKLAAIGIWFSKIIQKSPVLAAGLDKIRSIIAAIAGAVAGAVTFDFLKEDETQRQIDDIVSYLDNLNETSTRAWEIQQQQAEALREAEDAFKKDANAIRKVTEAYKQQNQEIIQNIQAQRLALDVSADQIEIYNTVVDISKRASDEIEKLVETKKNLSQEDARLIPIINAQIAAIKNRAQTDTTAATQELQNLQARRLEQEKLLKSTELLQEQLASDTQLSQLRDQIELIGLMGDELEDAQLILQVSQELENKLLELRRSELDLLARKTQLSEEQFQMELDHINKLREAASQYANDRLTLEREVLEKTRAAQNDWQATLKEQLQELADSITPAKTAADLFGSVIGSIDDALTQFVQKGKFNFKDFASSLLRDMAMIVARAMVMRAILGAVGMIFPGSVTGLSALLNAAPRRAGGPVSASNPYLVGEAGPELFMPKTAGTIIPNNQLGMMGGGTTVNYNIQAVDASSFRSLVARDPSFIYNVTEVGRRSSPNRRLG